MTELGPKVYFRLWQGLISATVLLMLSSPVWAKPSAYNIWDMLRQGGHVALLRHAIAPGTGDPPEFTLRDCATQRNLSTAGRRQATAIGERFRENGIPFAQVFSSQWCRCLETARLLDLGPVVELSLLNSFFRHFERREGQTAELKGWLAAQALARPTVLVTHQVNITALTGVYPASGELVVIEVGDQGEVSVVGTLETDRGLQQRKAKELFLPPDRRLALR